ncbi:MAG: 50S ribosomal protein L16 [Candidatus ainarchaeum sp.]|jgi:large subunit ribosomal protein L10e|nr:50S ribosomal protein L16 [Candidatus ainarchaeum sp.]
MGVRPGHCYNPKVNKRAYTRVAKRVHRKNYVGGTPGIKVRQYHMGFGEKQYSHVVHYVTAEKIQIRDSALESVRTTVVRNLNKKLTAQNFYMKLRVYPQFFLRENKQAQGAKADRIQQGMSQCPFGKVVGVAARVKSNQKLFSVLVDEANVEFVKKVFERLDSKLPCRMKVVIEENKDNLKSVGTTKKRRKLAAMAEEEKKAEEAKAQELKAAKGKVVAGKDAKAPAGKAAPAAKKDDKKKK